MSNDTGGRGPLDLTGAWRVVHHVEKSERSAFVGLRIEFQITLRQNGDEITGEGEKFLVDWRLAARDEASRLTVEGRVDGPRVHVSLIERAPHDLERAITGRIDWTFVEPDRLSGTFQVDLAETSGRSDAQRST